MRGRRGTYASQLQNFGGKVFENGGNVDGSLGADAHLALCPVLEESLHTTARKL